MGELSIHSMADYQQRFGCNIFVETGSGRGVGLKYASSFQGWSRLYSIEIHIQLYEMLKREVDKHVRDSRITLINKESPRALDELLPSISPDDVILFWLDAHFPGADFGLSRYDADEPLEIKLPLRREVEIIHKHRRNCKDVFIIDDLRLYEDLEFERPFRGDGEYAAQYKTSNQFIYDLFSGSHDISKDLRHEGFLILTPR